MSLFGAAGGRGDGDERPAAPPHAPLADRMRPRTLEEYLGQDEVVGVDRGLRAAIEAGNTGSLILFGPPGVGKTTLALLIAERSGLHFEPFSAVLSGVKEVRAAIADARHRRRLEDVGTLLFVDEIHRFNKAQQDAFLPHVESGEIVLVGATTENPSFSVIPALLSRCRAVQLRAIDDDSLAALVRRALDDAERGLGARALTIADDALEKLILHANGDARRALVCLESASFLVPGDSEIELEHVVDAMQHRTLLHDRSGDRHFDLLSALHKSLRNSDVQASVYWLARFLESGADATQVARRMVAMASEDIGLADPMSMLVATSALTALERIGMPEARLSLTQAAIHLASAPKSNAVYRAIDAAQKLVREGAQHEVPLHLRNAPTRLMKDLGHGREYLYSHDHDGGVAPMECLPEKLVGQRFYEPSDRGHEPKVAQRMADADARRRGGKGRGDGAR